MSLSLTRTFLFTDIEGSTKLWETHHDAMQVALARHDNLLREAIEQHNGIVFKTIGDAFCAVFESPIDAAQAAIQAQLALAAEAWPNPVQIRVRMAVHTGVAECRDNDYFGPTLNRTARLLSIGHGGQSLLSLAAYELSRDQLSPELSLADLGMHRLKDLIRPEHVFQLNAPSLTTRVAALRSLNHFANNLPQQLTSFIGREEELNKLIALLTSSRLVTLTGTGGCGKSRMALQLGADLLERFPDGVWFVELAPLTDPTLVPHAVAEAIGIPELRGDPTKALCQILSDRKMLVILDNCEHLVEACARLASALTKTCPQLSLLTTSREALHISGEQLFRVPSLSLPERHPPPAANKLSQFTAVQLFIDRAQAVQPDFTVTNANAPHVAEICWRLDGIPLAIELAAARLRNMAIEDLLTRLENRFRIVIGGNPDRLPRQQTLRALIDWSYDLLSENEQVLLSRLSVFMGGWSLEAAEGICSGDIIEEWEVLDLVSSLVDKSLVILDGSRYKMLETIKQYAQEKAAQQGETERLRERHLAWFKHKVEAQFQKFAYEDEPRAFECLSDDLANLKNALNYAKSQGDSLAVLVLAALPKAIWLFSHFEVELCAYLEEALAHREEMPVSAFRGFALSSEGGYQWSLGNLERGERLAEEAVAIQRNRGDTVGIADALFNLGLICGYQSRFDYSFACLEEAIALDHTNGLTNWKYSALHNLGYVHILAGNYATGEKLIRQCLAEEEKSLNFGQLLDCLAEVCLKTGRREEAILNYRKAIRENLRTQDWREVAAQLSAFGRITLGAGQIERSVRLYGAASALRRRYFLTPYPHEQTALDQDLEKAREQLAPELFERAWTAGLAMSVDEAIADAITPEESQ